ncbi:MAG: Gfo/Idh/MocA family oxidoreductase [Gemmatimonadota bacterium]
MTTAPQLRIGVLGAGPIAQAAHFDAIVKARNCSLHAICDLAPDLLERMSAVHQPSVAYGDYDMMLADPAVDAVLIATADAFHVPAALRAIAAGKHVLVEKPAGVAVEEVRQLRDAVRASDRVLQVGHMKRFDPGIAFARHFIREELGQLVALKAWYADSAYRYQMTDALQPVPVRSQGARRPSTDPKADRAQYYLLTHGSHLIDTARFLVGEITSVDARLVRRGDMFCWFVATEFADGSNGHLDLTVAVQMDWHEGFQVYGTEGSVLAKTFLPWFFRASEVECFSARDRTYHRPLGEDAHVFRRQVEAFADTILSGAPQVGADIDDGLATTQVMVAIARSAAGAGRVRVADVTGAV